MRKKVIRVCRFRVLQGYLGTELEKLVEKYS